MTALIKESNIIWGLITVIFWKEFLMDISSQPWYLELVYRGDKQTIEGSLIQKIGNGQVRIELKAKTINEALTEGKSHREALGPRVCVHDLGKVVSYSGKPGCSFILSSASLKA